MIEYKYDEKTYVKMCMRIGIWVYVAILSVPVAIFAGVCASIIASDVKEGEDWVFTLLAVGLLAVLFAILVAAMFVGIRKQLSKSFAMYSANGITHERVEITDEELIITNVSRQSVVKLKRSNIASVKLYKNFFTVVNKMKANWVVPLNGQTQLLYDVLTGRANPSNVPTDVKAEEGVTVEEHHADSVPHDPNALSFEYELTEQQAIAMLTKIISVRFRIVLAAIVVTSFLALVLTAITVGNYLTGNEIDTWDIVLAVAGAIGAALFTVAYCGKNKKGRTLGSNYFQNSAKDGSFVQRIELYDQGIVVANRLRETRLYFRLTDMDRVCLFKDFFFVEFKSKELLPIPLTEQTRKLYDILNNAIKRK